MSEVKQLNNLIRPKGDLVVVYHDPIDRPETPLTFIPERITGLTTNRSLWWLSSTPNITAYFILWSEKEITPKSILIPNMDNMLPPTSPLDPIGIEAMYVRAHSSTNDRGSKYDVIPRAYMLKYIKENYPSPVVRVFPADKVAFVPTTGKVLPYDIVELSYGQGSHNTDLKTLRGEQISKDTLPNAKRYGVPDDSPAFVMRTDARDRFAFAIYGSSVPHETGRIVDRSPLIHLDDLDSCTDSINTVLAGIRPERAGQAVEELTPQQALLATVVNYTPRMLTEAHKLVWNTSTLPRVSGILDRLAKVKRNVKAKSKPKATTKRSSIAVTPEIRSKVEQVRLEQGLTNQSQAIAYLLNK